LAPVLGVDFHTIFQHLSNDRGRGHRKHPAQAESRAPIESQCNTRRAYEQHGHGDLRSAQAEDDSLHREKPRQTEFQPDAEHQEHHAELCEIARFATVGNDP
jgi:hypothetical protein